MFPGGPTEYIILHFGERWNSLKGCHTDYLFYCINVWLHRSFHMSLHVEFNWFLSIYLMLSLWAISVTSFYHYHSNETCKKWGVQTSGRRIVSKCYPESIEWENYFLNSYKKSLQTAQTVFSFWTKEFVIFVIFISFRRVDFVVFHYLFEKLENSFNLISTFI